MASPNVFFDANILLYTDDPRFPAKQKIATTLVTEHARQKTGTVSLQALGEYFHNARRKLRLDVALARQRTIFFTRMLKFQPGLEDVFAAIDLHHLHQIGYWDAMIVRAATQTGCRVLYSEDLQHGRRFGSVEIVNPFL